MSQVRGHLRPVADRRRIGLHSAVEPPSDGQIERAGPAGRRLHVDAGPVGPVPGREARSQIEEAGGSGDAAVRALPDVVALGPAVGHEPAPDLHPGGRADLEHRIPVAVQPVGVPRLKLVRRGEAERARADPDLQLIPLPDPRSAPVDPREVVARPGRHDQLRRGRVVHRELPGHRLRDAPPHQRRGQPDFGRAARRDHPQRHGVDPPRGCGRPKVVSDAPVVGVPVRRVVLDPVDHALRRILGLATVVVARSAPPFTGDRRARGRSDFDLELGERGRRVAGERGALPGRLVLDRDREPVGREGPFLHHRHDAGDRIARVVLAARLRRGRPGEDQPSARQQRRAEREQRCPPHDCRPATSLIRAASAKSKSVIPPASCVFSPILTVL